MPWRSFAVAGLAMSLLIVGCAKYDTPSGPRLGTAPPLSWTFPVNPQPLPGGAPPAQAGAGASDDDLGPPAADAPPAADLSGYVSWSRGPHLQHRQPTAVPRP